MPNTIVENTQGENQSIIALNTFSKLSPVGATNDDRAHTSNVPISGSGVTKKTNQEAPDVETSFCFLNILSFERTIC